MQAMKNYATLGKNAVCVQKHYIFFSKDRFHDYVD